MGPPATPRALHERVERLMGSVRELPTLPAIATRVAAVARDPDSTARDMAAVIGQDQALTANLLRVVNSAYFGFLRRIASVFEAINLLGYQEVVKMAFTVAVIRELDYDSANGFDRRAFWTHAVCTAAASEWLAKRLACAPPEEAYTGGLLHDMGKLILDQFFPEDFGAILARLHEAPGSCEAEREVLGATHAEIGAWVARTWLLPESAIAAILHHHDPRGERHGLPNSDDPVVD
ncbi:MAG: HDOD domain-containing protein, partial [Nitrospirae bacterium]